MFIPLTSNTHTHGLTVGRYVTWQCMCGEIVIIIILNDTQCIVAFIIMLHDYDVFFIISGSHEIFDLFHSLHRPQIAPKIDLLSLLRIQNYGSRPAQVVVWICV